MLINNLENFIVEKKASNLPKSVIINLVKEYLQYSVLSYIYRQKNYQHFIFIGGSALRIIYNLPRLSEDLDFNLLPNNYQNLDLETLGQDISQYFWNNWQIKITYKAQHKLRLYLKFPILKKFNLAQVNDSDFLFIKIETQAEDFKNSEIELSPISKYGFNFICQHYSLKFLMTGKILAILNRKWFKGKDNEIEIKGRDYYDLYWYLNNNIEPDYVSLKEKLGIKDKADLNKILSKQIKEKVSSSQLLYDLENFFPDQLFINDFCQNYHLIIKKHLL